MHAGKTVQEKEIMTLSLIIGGLQDYLQLTILLPAYEIISVL
jgi:hypothetical protein